MCRWPDLGSVLQLVYSEIRADKEEREKRKLDELSSSSLDSSLESKRRRMDGSKAAERVIGSQRDIEFSDILFKGVSGLESRTKGR